MLGPSDLWFLAKSRIDRLLYRPVVLFLRARVSNLEKSTSRWYVSRKAQIFGHLIWCSVCIRVVVDL
jgi:hypothetical protein